MNIEEYDENIPEILPNLSSETVVYSNNISVYFYTVQGQQYCMFSVKSVEWDVHNSFGSFELVAVGSCS